jgi:hypothetical protein
LARSYTLDRSNVRGQIKVLQVEGGLGVRLPTSLRNSPCVNKPNDGYRIIRLEDSHPHETTDKIIITYILICSLLSYLEKIE